MNERWLTEGKILGVYDGYESGENKCGKSHEL
jgi:hypothetical protein